MPAAMTHSLETIGGSVGDGEDAVGLRCRHFSVSNRGENVFVRFFSRFLSEAAAVEMAPELLEMIERGECRSLNLDFCRVERLSSAMLAKTVKFKRNLDAKGGKLRLINICPHVRHVFAVTKLDQILEIAERETGEPGVLSCEAGDGQ